MEYILTLKNLIKRIKSKLFPHKCTYDRYGAWILINEKTVSKYTEVGDLIRIRFYKCRICGQQKDKQYLIIAKTNDLKMAEDNKGKTTVDFHLEK
jgi:hypothetical protein